jgi:hypothetical protein
LRAGWTFGILTLVLFGLATWGIAAAVAECADECHRFVIYWLAAAFLALTGLIVLLASLDLQITGSVHRVVRALASVVFGVSLFLIGWVLLALTWFLIVRGDPASAGLHSLISGVPAAVGVLAFLLIRRLVAVVDER